MERGMPPQGQAQLHLLHLRGTELFCPKIVTRFGDPFQGTYNTKKNYSGGMTTIGVQVAF
ncbi:MAG: hypothetical protein DSY95_07410 [SAR324 cluster bacterium]|uniref:Uncharacterized protein n=1 Tax=SAR324 cluster bacterium TaxID=2024889 RepID=A0A432GK65_9DELT|nr:MAG: hypothetical protein DSY95_07410 [SAR324 cluster bacterium]